MQNVHFSGIFCGYHGYHGTTTQHWPDYVTKSTHPYQKLSDSALIPNPCLYSTQARLKSTSPLKRCWITVHSPSSSNTQRTSNGSESAGESWWIPVDLLVMSLQSTIMQPTQSIKQVRVCWWKLVDTSSLIGNIPTVYNNATRTKHQPGQSW